MSNRVYFVINGKRQGQIFGNNEFAPFNVSEEQCEYLKWFEKYTNYNDISETPDLEDIDGNKDFINVDRWVFRVSVKLDEELTWYYDLLNAIYDDMVAYRNETLSDREVYKKEWKDEPKEEIEKEIEFRYPDIFDLKEYFERDYSRREYSNSRRGLLLSSTIMETRSMLLVSIKNYLGKPKEIESFKIEMW